MATSLKRLLYPIYAYCLFDEMMFIYPLYAVMFQEQGLGPVRISALLTIWCIAVFVLEVPSGAVADKYSRKHILLFAQIGKALGFTSWLLFPSFWGFAAGFILWGTSGAFSGGTFEALVYDELKYAGQEGLYARIMGRARSASMIGVMIADFSSAGMIRFGYGFVILASLLSLAVSCGAILLVRPAKRSGLAHETHYLTHLKEGTCEAVRNREILRLVVFVCFGLTFFGALEEYWSLFGIQAGIGLAGIGILSGVISCSQVVAGATAHRFERLPDRSIYGMFLLSGVILLIGSYLMRPVSLVFVIAFCVVLTIVDVLMDARLQHAIEVSSRATVSSVRNFAGEIASIPIYMGFGLIAGRCGYRDGFLASALVMVLIGAIYVGFSSRRISEPQGRDPDNLVIGKK